MDELPNIAAIQSLTAAAPKFMDRSGAQKQLSPEQMKLKAQEYEAQVLGTMLNSMEKTVDREDDLFGGGNAEETWRGMLNEEYGKIIAKNGGIGLADSVVHELVRLQSNANKESPL